MATTTPRHPRAPPSNPPWSTPTGACRTWSTTAAASRGKDVEVVFDGEKVKFKSNEAGPHRRAGEQRGDLQPPRQRNLPRPTSRMPAATTSPSARRSTPARSSPMARSCSSRATASTSCWTTRGRGPARLRHRGGLEAEAAARGPHRRHAAPRHLQPAHRPVIHRGPCARFPEEGRCAPGTISFRTCCPRSSGARADRRAAHPACRHRRSARSRACWREDLDRITTRDGKTAPTTCRSRMASRASSSWALRSMATTSASRWRTAPAWLTAAPATPAAAACTRRTAS
jgi:hypothetical protein